MEEKYKIIQRNDGIYLVYKYVSSKYWDFTGVKGTLEQCEEFVERQLI
jgi:hypothetical protein